MLPVIFSNAASELIEISNAGAKALKALGMDMQPVKREMLKLNDAEADLVLTACNMLFAALLEYEGGLWEEKHAKHAVALVTARVAAGRANAVIESLFFGPTARLLWLALDRAPIAYSGLAAASPSQNIIDRTYKWTAANRLK
jgi:hypothetical protein